MPVKYKPVNSKPIVQISLDLTNIDEALETAAMAMQAGVDWLKSGQVVDLEQHPFIGRNPPKDTSTIKVSK